MGRRAVLVFRYMRTRRSAAKMAVGTVTGSMATASSICPSRVGALLVADDAGNVVWRVSAADGSISDAAVGNDGQRHEAQGDVPDFWFIVAFME